MIDFGPWLPDHPSLGHPGVLSLQNAFPAVRGFKAVKSANALTGNKLRIGAVSGGAAATEINMPRIRGILSTVQVQSGSLVTNIFAGTDTRLVKLDAGTNKFQEFNYANSSAADPTYSNVVRWRFQEFATTGSGARVVYAASGVGQALQKFDSNGSTAPTSVSGAPNATHVAAVGRFLVCANTSTSEAEVVWSAIDDANTWTNGTDQSGAQILADTSEITGLIGGETGLIFTRTGIYRMNYLGPPLVFGFEKVSNQGCEFAGSTAARSSNEAFFLSSDGFQRYVDGRVINIGSERVNDFFFNSFDRSRPNDIECIIDPASSLVIWSYPSQNADADENDSLIVYDYTLDKWGIAKIDHEMIGHVRQLGATLESLDTDADGNPQTLEDLTTTLDAGIYAGGSTVLTLAQSGAAGSFLSALTGTPLTLTLETGEFEPAEKQLVLVRSISPHIEGASADAAVSCAVGSRSRQIDVVNFSEPAAVNANNIIPARKTGRYFSLKFTASGNWSQAFGFSLDATAQGRR